MSNAVVFYDTRMIYRKIGGILSKVSHRIAAAAHYVLDQRVGTIHGSPRVVHKLRLLAAPVFGISRAVFGLERLNVKLGDALCSFSEFRFRIPAISMFGEGLVVFRTKFR
jgi:hypothetical protein